MHIVHAMMGDFWFIWGGLGAELLIFAVIATYALRRSESREA